MGRTKTEQFSIRIRKDQYEFIERLAQDNGSNKSSVMRDMIAFYQGTVESDLAEKQFKDLLKKKGYEVIPPGEKEKD